MWDNLLQVVTFLSKMIKKTHFKMLFCCEFFCFESCDNLIELNRVQSCEITSTDDRYCNSFFQELKVISLVH